MEEYLPLIGLAAVTLVTPGPNNIIVLGQAAKNGFWRTTPLALAVIVGAASLYFLIYFGIGRYLETVPYLREVLLGLGCAYLIYLGIKLINAAQPTNANGNTEHKTVTFKGMMLFQPLNPKAWVFNSTMIAALPPDLWSVSVFAVVFSGIAIACLSLWMFGGSLLTKWLATGNNRKIFNGVMGLALIGCAAFLAIDGLGIVERIG